MRPTEQHPKAPPDLLPHLEGDWRVERTGGQLPPMTGVWKRIRGERGETCIGPLPVWPFRLERRAGHVALIYRPPFRMFVDELRPGPDESSWLGRATVAGREIGRFRMLRLKRRRAAGGL